MSRIDEGITLDMNVIRAKPIEELSLIELQARLKDLEGNVERAKIVSREEIINEDDVVEINVPKSPGGDIFMINGREFLGKQVLPFRLARQLATMVSDSYECERWRLISRNKERGQNVINPFTPDDPLRMKKFQQLVNQGGN